MRWGIIAALVFCCGFCAADEIDLEAVRETLDAAIDQYFKDVIDVDKKITESIDRRIRMKGNLGDLEGVLTLKEQRAKYLTQGVLPKDNVYRATRQQAEFGINRAKSRLDTAYEEAIEGLTKQGRYTDAKRIRDERLRLEQKLAVPESELRPTKIINRARERNNPPNEQSKDDALAAGMNKEKVEIDQPVPEILKEIDGELSGEQQHFVQNIQILNDGVAKALAQAKGSLRFDSLKEINGWHAAMLLTGPWKLLEFRGPTKFTEDFLFVMENCKRKVYLRVFSTPISIVHFERLMTKSNLTFCYSLNLHTDAHIQKLLELGKKPRCNFLITSQHLQEDLDVALEIQPNGEDHYTLVNDNESKLQANLVKGVEKLASLLILRDFKEFDTDMLSVLEKRSENGFPTLFINCVTADIEFQKQLENYGSTFLIDPSKDAIERSIMKWRNDTKLVDQNVEKPPVTQHPEGNLRDQTVPKILKEINGRLSDGQQYFVRNLASLTDGIAKALSPAEGPLFFDSLKKISGRHAEIILDGPRKYLEFRHATEFTEDFLSVIEKCEKDVGLYIFSTPISVIHFERLMTNENLNFCYSLHLYTGDHIQKILELGKKPGGEFFTSQHLQEDLDVALAMQPNGAVFYKFWNDDGSKLQARNVDGIEKLASLLVLLNFKNIDLDMLPVFEERGANGFPTLFLNCVIPNNEFQERLEGYNFLFLSIDEASIDETIQRSIDKWTKNKKKLTE